MPTARSHLAVATSGGYPTALGATQEVGGLVHRADIGTRLDAQQQLVVLGPQLGHLRPQLGLGRQRTIDGDPGRHAARQRNEVSGRALGLLRVGPRQGSDLVEAARPTADAGQHRVAALVPFVDPAGLGPGGLHLPGVGVGARDDRLGPPLGQRFREVARSLRTRRAPLRGRGRTRGLRIGGEQPHPEGQRRRADPPSDPARAARLVAIERRHDRTHVFWPLRRIDRHPRPEHASQAAGHRPLDAPVLHVVPQRLEGTAGERALARQRLPDRDAEREHIGSRAHGPALELLRRHVGRRPHHDPRSRSGARDPPAAARRSPRSPRPDPRPRGARARSRRPGPPRRDRRARCPA